MKICYVDEDGRFGGPQQRMLLIASELKKKNISVEVVIPKDETEIFKKKLINENIKFYELNITRLSLKISFLVKYVFLFIYEIILLINFFKKKNYDLIQANSTPQFKAVIAALILKKKTIWVLEDSYFPKIVVFFFNLLAKLSNCKIIYTSDRVKKFYFKNENKFKNKKKEIFAPVDFNRFNYEKSFSKPSFIENDKIIITTVASLVPVKGLEYFIEMADLISESYKNVHFIIAGPEISSQKKYSNKIKENIQKKNYINYMGMYEDVPQLLYYSDIFVCTSLSEAGPMTVYEAMSMKLPVVTTDVGASYQIIDNLNSGIIVPIKNSKELAKSVKILLEDADLRKKIGSNAYNVAKKYFSLEKIVNQYLEFYNTN